MKWKMAPTEPTPQMKNAAVKVEIEGIDCLTWEEATSVYQDMLSAAPDPLEDEALRERVARAIHAADDVNETYEEMKAFFDALADAAIAAMRG